MTVFQTVFVPVCALLALAVLLRALRTPGSRRSGFFWTSVWTVAAMLIADPWATTTIASWVGIGRGADLILYVATLAGLAAALFFYVRFRRLEVIITGIIRREALQSPRRGEHVVAPPV